MKVLCLISARGGSKGVPRKNIKLLNGKPLIAYSIEVAKLCSKISDIVVSTDDFEIAEIAKSYGAEIPFIRDKKLAQDNSKHVDVIIDTLLRLEEMNRKYDYVILLQPTSPIRAVEDLDKAIDLLDIEKLDSVISLTDSDDPHPYFFYKIDENGYVKVFDERSQGCNRQELPNFYWRNGSIYCFTTQQVLNHKTIFGEKIKSIFIPRERSFNINNPFDFEMVEAYMQFKNKTHN